MIEPALRFVYDKAAEIAATKRAQIVEDLSDSRTHVVEHDGKLIERAIKPDLRRHTVRSVEDLTNAAAKWNTAPVVWIDGTKVVLIIDDEDRRETVTLPLVEAAVFKTVKGLKGSIDQASLIRLLRVELRKTLNQPAILTAVRKVKFRQLSAGQSDIQHGNESLGQQIEAEVTGAGDIPDSLVVETNVFSNPGELDYRATIGLDLEIDAKAQRFVLRPMPDEIERVTDAALFDIRSRIEMSLAGASIFFGSP